MAQEAEKQIYDLLMRYIDSKYPELAESDSPKKYDLYLKILNHLQKKYKDYLRGYFIDYLKDAEIFDKKHDEKMIEELDELLKTL